MSAPYIKYFDGALPDGSDLACIVMDEEEFNQLCEAIRQSPPTGLTDEHVNQLKKAKHIPLMSRGMKTEHVFKKYGIRADVMKIGVMVRGEGLKAVMSTINRIDKGTK